MTKNEKLAVLMSLENIPKFSNDHFRFLNRLSYDSNAMIRAYTATMLAGGKDRQAAEILIRLIKDKNSWVRVEAYDSLSDYPTVKVQDVLVDAILQEVDDLARSYAIQSWTDISQKLSDFSIFKQELSDKVHELLKREKNDRCKLYYYNALVKFGNLEAMNDMLKYLDHPDYHIRCSLLSCLYSLEIKDDLDEIYNLLVEKEKTDNSRAVRCEIKKLLNERLKKLK